MEQQIYQKIDSLIARRPIEMGEDTAVRVIFEHVLTPAAVVDLDAEYEKYLEQKSSGSERNSGLTKLFSSTVDLHKLISSFSSAFQAKKQEIVSFNEGQTFYDARRIMENLRGLEIAFDREQAWL